MADNTNDGGRRTGKCFGRLLGRVAIVTGASRGIGQVIALEFAKQGCAISLVATGQTALEDTASQIERVGGRAIIQPFDVTDRESCFRAVKGCESQLGEVAILVNAAGAYIANRFLDYSAE